MENDNRYFGVKSIAAADFLDARNGLPRDQRHLLTGPKMKQLGPAFWLAFHVLRQDEPLFVFGGSVAVVGMCIHAAYRVVGQLFGL